MSFDEFWAAYPNKKAKLAARKAYDKALKHATHEEIMAGIAPYMDNKPNWQDFAHPTTFLNQGRWLDEYEQPSMPKVDPVKSEEFQRRRHITEIVNKRKMELRFNVVDISLTADEREWADEYLKQA